MHLFKPLQLVVCKLLRFFYKLETFTNIFFFLLKFNGDGTYSLFIISTKMVCYKQKKSKLKDNHKFSFYFSSLKVSTIERFEPELYKEMHAKNNGKLPEKVYFNKGL